MNIIPASNLFKLLTDASAYIQSYHLGLAEEIEANIQNFYNQNAATGKFFPHLQWVMPTDGSINATGVDTTGVSLRLYHLNGYENDGSLSTETVAVRLDRMKAAAIEVYMAIKDKRHAVNPVARGFSVNGEAKYFTDTAATSIHRLLVVGLDFDLSIAFSCDDYQPAGQLPLYDTLPEIIPDNIELEYGT